jgi:hypothetical protein
VLSTASLSASAALKAPPTCSCAASRAAAVNQVALLPLLLLFLLPLLLGLEPKPPARVLKRLALPLTAGMRGALPVVLLLLMPGPCAGRGKTRDGVNGAELGVNMGTVAVTPVLVRGYSVQAGGDTVCLFVVSCRLAASCRYQQRPKVGQLAPSVTRSCCQHMSGVMHAHNRLCDWPHTARPSPPPPWHSSLIRA